MPNHVAQRTLQVGGMERSYLRVAADGGPRDAAAILLLHGSNQTGSTLRRFAKGTFDGLSSRGATIAYLDGYKGAGTMRDCRRRLLRRRQTSMTPRS